jgi:hypothetical protein
MSTEQEDINPELPEDSHPEHLEINKEAEEIPGETRVNENEENVPGENSQNINEEAKTRQYIRNRTILSFTVFGLAFIIFIMWFSWINHQPRLPGQDGALKPLRSALDFNEKVNRNFFSETHLAPEYPITKAAKEPRVNGDIGMNEDYDTSEWILNVVNIDSHDTMTFSLDQIKKLPKTEIVFNFKCIEGWSEITHWGGVRFCEFINHYKLARHPGSNEFAKYAGFETPDGAYYVGIDMPSAMHPQTLLCYEMNGKPLPFDQGAPLRLIVPVKYGIKSLKRIGVIYFSDKRPRDYWYEQGYDYDAAL